MALVNRLSPEAFALSRRKITSIAGGKAWIDMIVANELLFHFDDDVYETLWGMEHDKPNTVDLLHLDARRNELYAGAFDWGEHDCPIGYALYAMEVHSNKGTKS